MPLFDWKKLAARILPNRRPKPAQPQKDANEIWWARRPTAKEIMLAEEIGNGDVEDAIHVYYKAKGERGDVPDDDPAVQEALLRYKNLMYIAADEELTMALRLPMNAELRGRSRIPRQLTAARAAALYDFIDRIFEIDVQEGMFVARSALASSSLEKDQKEHCAEAILKNFSAYEKFLRDRPSFTTKALTEDNLDRQLMAEVDACHKAEIFEEILLNGPYSDPAIEAKATGLWRANVLAMDLRRAINMIAILGETLDRHQKTPGNTRLPFYDETTAMWRTLKCRQAEQSVGDAVGGLRFIVRQHPPDYPLWVASKELLRELEPREAEAMRKLRDRFPSTP